MESKNILCLAFALIMSLASNASCDVLLQQSNFTYKGAFYYPSDWSTDSSGQTGKGLVYNPSGNGGAGSLFAVTNNTAVPTPVGEMSIPTLYTGTSSSSVPEATILQSPVDITSGNQTHIDANGATYGGGGSAQLAAIGLYNGNLIGSVYATYNANNEVYNQFITHTGTSVSSGTFDGTFPLSLTSSATPSGLPSSISGKGVQMSGSYMCAVPSGYQTQLGGTYLTGAGNGSIISQTSNGPSLYAFTPSTSSVGSVVPLLWYYNASPYNTLGSWGTTTQYTSINDKFLGCVFPANSRSVIIFGSHGTGTSCYGPASSETTDLTNGIGPATNAQIVSYYNSTGKNWSCAGTSMNGADGDACCNDNDDHAKGTHSYPYNYQAWAYDVGNPDGSNTSGNAVGTNNTLTAVKLGITQPYNLLPYAMWAVPMQFDSSGSLGFHTGIGGAAYDSTNQRVFLVQRDTGIIQVFGLNLSAVTNTPTVTSFTMPATSTSLTVPISSFTATDNTGVTGYLVTESSTAPATSASGWSSTAPTSYTFSAAGNKVAYARAKTAAGNVSASVSASTAITLPDTTAPTVTTFTMPSTATSLSVSISSFTASDNVGVTGYLVTGDSTPPSTSASGWSGTAPTSYTFSSAGSQKCYAWAKDAAGNLSNGISASVTITLPDTTAPTVSAFTLPSTSTSLTVAISSFTATDNVGVTGYLVTSSSTAPSASASGWSSTAPTSYVFSASGSQTAYAWAKDAAGNVSAAKSAGVTITLSGTTVYRHKQSKR